MQLAASLYPPWYLNKENIREWHQMCMDVCTGEWGWLLSNCLGSHVFMRFLSTPISTRFLKHHPQALVTLPTLASPVFRVTWKLQDSGVNFSLLDYRISPARPAGYYVKCDEKGRRWLVIPLKNKGKKKINHRIPFLFHWPKASSLPRLKKKAHLGSWLCSGVCWRRNQ